MKIALCIKQVPDTSDIKWTEHNTIKREGLESILNPYDVYAIEAALKIKKECKNVTVTALTMGPLQAEAISVGIDDGALITDRKFAGADTYATGKTLAQAIKTVVPDFDIIICGQFAIDGDTAQTGPSIANHLNIPQITFVQSIESCDDKSITVKRKIEDGIEILNADYPVLLCMLQDAQEPTRATINGVKKAQHSIIKHYSIDDINLLPDDAGLKGSPTYVSKAFRPIVKHDCTLIKYTDDNCEEMCEKFKEFVAGANE